MVAPFYALIGVVHSLSSPTRVQGLGEMGTGIGVSLVLTVFAYTTLQYNKYLLVVQHERRLRKQKEAQEQQLQLEVECQQDDMNVNRQSDLHVDTEDASATAMVSKKATVVLCVSFLLLFLISCLCALKSGSSVLFSALFNKIPLLLSHIVFYTILVSD